MRALNGHYALAGTLRRDVHTVKVALWTHPGQYSPPIEPKTTRQVEVDAVRRTDQPAPLTDRTSASTSNRQDISQHL